MQRDEIFVQLHPHVVERFAHDASESARLASSHCIGGGSKSESVSSESRNDGCHGSENRINGPSDGLESLEQSVILLLSVVVWFAVGFQLPPCTEAP